MTDKQAMYLAEHMREYRARPFWTEIPDGMCRLAAYAWWVELERFCEEVSNDSRPPA